jgi:hypothetical protein
MRVEQIWQFETAGIMLFDRSDRFRDLQKVATVSRKSQMAPGLAGFFWGFTLLCADRDLSCRDRPTRR